MTTDIFQRLVIFVLPVGIVSSNSNLVVAQELEDAPRLAMAFPFWNGHGWSATSDGVFQCRRRRRTAQVPELRSGRRWDEAWAMAGEPPWYVWRWAAYMWNHVKSITDWILLVDLQVPRQPLYLGVSEKLWILVHERPIWWEGHWWNTRKTQKMSGKFSDKAMYCRSRCVIIT